jgi:hypothetical protein
LGDEEVRAIGKIEAIGDDFPLIPIEPLQVKIFLE